MKPKAAPLKRLKKKTKNQKNPDKPLVRLMREKGIINIKNKKRETAKNTTDF